MNFFNFTILIISIVLTNLVVYDAISEIPDKQDGPKRVQALFKFFIKRNDINNNNNTSLMSILDAILNDPEFLRLDSKQQLQLLMIIYNMLEAHYKRQFGA